MKKFITIIFLFAVLTMFTSCSNFSPNNDIGSDSVTAEKYKVYLDIESENNLLFSTYDITIFLNGKEIGTVANGKRFVSTVEVTKEQNELSFCKASDTSPKSTRKIKVTEDMSYECTLGHSSSSIDIKNETVTSGLIETDIEMVDVTGYILSEAESKLYSIGFTEIKSAADSGIWDKNNWVVSTQNYKPGTKVNKYSVIQLFCVRPSEYNAQTTKSTMDFQPADTQSTGVQTAEIQKSTENAANKSEETVTAESDKAEAEAKAKAEAEAKAKAEAEAKAKAEAEAKAKAEAEAKAKAEAEAKAKAEAEAKAKAEAEAKAKAEAEAKAKAEAEAKAKEEAEAKAKAEAEAKAKAEAEAKAKAEAEAKAKAEADAKAKAEAEAKAKAEAEAKAKAEAEAKAKAEAEAKAKAEAEAKAKAEAEAKAKAEAEAKAKAEAEAKAKAEAEAKAKAEAEAKAKAEAEAKAKAEAEAKAKAEAEAKAKAEAEAKAKAEAEAKAKAEAEAKAKAEADAKAKAEAEKTKTSTSDRYYVLNTHTMKFHYPSCPSVDQISPENYSVSTKSSEEIKLDGYKPCKRCNP